MQSFQPYTRHHIPLLGSGSGRQGAVAHGGLSSTRQAIADAKGSTASVTSGRGLKGTHDHAATTSERRVQSREGAAYG